MDVGGRLPGEIARSAVRWAVTVLLWCLLARQILLRGPLTFEAPLTPLTNAEPAMRASEPYILFLRAVESRLPNGATVAILQPAEAMGYLQSIGQLPRQRVLIPAALGAAPPAALPEWVAVFGVPFDDPRYALAERVAGGSLHRRRP